ncbi:MAG: imidazole glycerol phosphate synthase subunit HisH [Ruminococcus sp.]|jgi:glutamine amidotransferase|nr:imidazole glycerol phosphate synthase subunit HisH [Ruminococcus sp.]
MVAIIDYGAGNIFSVQNALNKLGIENKLTNSAKEIESADKLILPGVGAFPAAMKMLGSFGLVDVLRRNTKPILGICLGMQMLFSESFEFGRCEGLGLIPGYVDKIKTKKILPHMGWNKLEFSNEYVYFVHSYKAFCSKRFIADYCEYDGIIPAYVRNGNVQGMQFHPEKSGEFGLELLRRFCEL